MTYPEAYGTSQALFSALDETPAIDGQEVSKLYFTGLSDKTPQDVLWRTIGKAFGDYTITCPTILFAKSLFKKDYKTSRVFQYYFNSKLSHWNPLCGKWMGVCHSADIEPEFGIPFLDTKRFNDRERYISGLMIHVFSTFAKTGFVFLIMCFIVVIIQIMMCLLVNRRQ